MSIQDDYKAGQKASGIEVGDTVRVLRGFEDHEDGCNTIWISCKKTSGEFVVEHLCGDGDIVLDDADAFGGHNYYPHFVLEIVKKASSTVPELTKEQIVDIGKLETNLGDSNMSTKTQEIYAVIVTENEPVKDAESGLIVKTKKKVIYSKGDLPAYDAGNATVKAILAAGKVKGVNAIKDEDEVEVKVSSPF